MWNSVNFIFGMPYETEADVEATFSMIERNADYIDGFAFHSFRMKRNSRFLDQAAEFGIAPRRDDAGHLTGGYDEIDGLTWEDRAERTRRHVREANELIHPDLCALAQNAHLILYLYKALGEKEAVRRWIVDLVDSNHKLLYRDAALT